MRRLGKLLHGSEVRTGFLAYPVPKKALGRHRTKKSAELRRQIFRQTKQKPQKILYVFARIFVKYDGKDASKSAL